ncbi:hypothetical protein ACOME3_010729 [Neoechinorhynchus agilis]
MERSAARHSAPGSLEEIERNDRRLKSRRIPSTKYLASSTTGQCCQRDGDGRGRTKAGIRREVMLTENDFHRTSPRIPNRFEKQVDNNDRAKIDERFKALEGKVKEF